MGLHLPHFNKSVCGCSVELGSKIIGFTILGLRSFTILIAIFVCLYMPNDETLGNNSQNKGAILTVETGTLIITIGYLIILSIFDVLMLIGVYKRRPSIIFPWIVVQVMAIFLGFLFLLNAIIEGAAHLYVIVRFTISYSIYSGYCILVVNSHYQNLKSEAT